jgi:hypothetical protein
MTGPSSSCASLGGGKGPRRYPNSQSFIWFQGRPVACRAVVSLLKQSADAVATSQKGRRSPKSDRAARHPRWGQARSPAQSKETCVL